jgi:hypothetical protein
MQESTSNDKVQGSRVKDPFVYQKASETQSAKIQEIMAAAQSMSAVLMTLTPSRESSLAITKLEECAMWANKSVAFNSQ